MKPRKEKITNPANTEVEQFPIVTMNVSLKEIKYKINRYTRVENNIHYKKFLLRERKRYTASCVASARSAALSPGREGVPHPVQPGRVTPSSLDGGTSSSPNGEISYQVLTGVYPTQS